MPVLVTRVSDGDTVVVREDRRFAQEFRVRLYGIDAPETSQPFGRESTQALQQMVRLQALALDVFAHDRYGRAIGLLYPRGGDQRQSLNVAMVREGWAYTYHRNGRYSHGLNAAQRQAQDARRGVWGQSASAERPWAYRRRMSERDGGVVLRPRALLWGLALLAMLYVLARVAGAG